MPKIPVYEPMTSPEAPLPGRSPERLYAEPQSFGGGVAAGLSSLGAGAEDASTTLYDTEQRKEVSDLSANAATLRGKLTADFQAQAAANAGQPGFTDKFLASADNQISALGANLNTRAGQQAFTREAASMRADFTVKAAEHNVAVAGAQATTNFQTMVNQNAGTLFNDPSQAQSVFKSVDDAFGDPAGPYAAIPAEHRAQLQAVAKEQLAVAAARGVAMSNPDLAEKLYKADSLPGQNFLTEAGNAQIVSYITTMQNAERTKQSLAMAQAEKTERVNAEADQVSVLRHMEANPSDPNIANMILKSRMKAPQMMVMLDLAKHLGGPGDNHDQNTYGPGFMDAYDAIHGNKITSPDQLYPQLRTGQLTVAGINMLTGEIVGKRTPEGENEAEMKRGFVKAFTQQLSGTNELMHIRDPRGDELVQHALTQFLPAYDKAKAEGKFPPSVLLDPNNPHSLWAGAINLKRTPQQMFRDLMTNNPGADIGGQAPDYKSAAEVTADYKAGKIDRATAAGILTKKGWAK